MTLVSFVKYRLFYRALLQKRPTVCFDYTNQRHPIPALRVETLLIEILNKLLEISSHKGWKEYRNGVFYVTWCKEYRHSMRVPYLYEYWYSVWIRNMIPVRILHEFVFMIPYWYRNHMFVPYLYEYWYSVWIRNMISVWILYESVFMTPYSYRHHIPYLYEYSSSHNVSSKNIASRYSLRENTPTQYCFRNIGSLRENTPTQYCLREYR